MSFDLVDGDDLSSSAVTAGYACPTFRLPAHNCRTVFKKCVGQFCLPV